MQAPGPDIINLCGHNLQIFVISQSVCQTSLAIDKHQLSTKIRKLRSKIVLYIATRGQCYKTFSVRNLRIFVMTQIICPRQAFPAQPYVCRKGQKPTQVKNISIAPLQDKLQPYTSTLDQKINVCQGQTVQLITKICKLRP